MKHVISLALFLAALSAFQLVSANSISLVTLEYPPYEYKDGGKVKGIVVDIVNEVFKRMEMTTNIKLNNWARSLHMVKKGQADAIFTAYKTSERETFLDYSHSVLMLQEVVIFVHKDSDIEFNGDLNALNKHRIGVVRGVSYGKVFDDARKQGAFSRLQEAVDMEDNVKKFSHRRFDVLVNNKYGALAMFKRLGLTDQFKQVGVLQSVPSYIAFSKERNLADVRDRFDKVLSNMITDGSYQRIIDSYAK